MSRNGPPAGGKRWLIREGGSASRVSIHARLRDPGGRTVSTDPRRRTVLNDVSVSVEQSGEEPTLVSSKCSTVQTGQASAEDTHNQECSYDVVGLYAHKGTMWNADDRVPRKDVRSPYGGGVSPLPGAAGGPPPAMFPVAPALLVDEPQLDSWQVAVVRVDETPGGLVEQISDEEPTVRQVSGSALDSQLMEGITYTEVSLDSRPMEGSSCLEPVEQSILLSSWTVSPRNCVIEQKSEWEPVITPAVSYALDSRPMEGMTYLEHPTPGVSLDSWPMEGAVIKQKSEWEPVITPAVSHTLDSRPLEGMTYLEHPAPGVSLDSWPMEGASCLRPLEQPVLNSSIAARPVEDVDREISKKEAGDKPGDGC